VCVPWLAAAPVDAQELDALAGAIWDVRTSQRSYTWKLAYMQGLSEHIIATWSDDVAGYANRHGWGGILTGRASYDVAHRLHRANGGQQLRQ
jgi:hypothetical protein